ncbi:MAG: hypothetical protein A2508_09910 [Candidatus Lambdaproteobacteria bacterium RIFOXYD12_FULL_49_8]|nr:MAG: hypothetical protein A2508_09910 [Candidatus Lambdaproteobacteria bacterium RIFOXYD12_FULL_49_8]
MNKSCILLLGGPLSFIRPRPKLAQKRDKIMVKKFISMVLILSVFVAAQPARAQDEGEPALKTMALFSVGGAAGGAALGVAVWMLDPLNPNSDFTNSMFTGLAVGTFAGLIFGGMQLQKQAVFPYYEDYPAPSNEFDDSSPFGPQGYLYRPGDKKNKNPRMPLAHFRFKF